MNVFILRVSCSNPVFNVTWVLKELEIESGITPEQTQYRAGGVIHHDKGENNCRYLGQTRFFGISVTHIIGGEGCSDK
jgi:hypothetical protein